MYILPTLNTLISYAFLHLSYYQRTTFSFSLISLFGMYNDAALIIINLQPINFHMYVCILLSFREAPSTLYTTISENSFILQRKLGNISYFSVTRFCKNSNWCMSCAVVVFLIMFILVLFPAFKPTKNHNLIFICVIIVIFP